MILKLHPDAEVDLNLARDQYAKIDPVLAERFVAMLDETFGRIQKFPHLYPFESATAQKILMKRFPFIVLYEVYHETIMILAIFNTNRDPKVLSDRLG